MAATSEVLAAANSLTPCLARIHARRQDSRDVWTLDIRPDAHDGALQANTFQPGQFNMLTVFGVGEIPVSLSGDAAKTDRLIHTVRPVGAVSRALTELRVGAVVGLRGPYGQGWPIPAEGQDVLVVAGGLGLAPLRPALYRLRAARQRYGRVTLLYGSRSPEDILYSRELERWRQGSHFDVQVTVDHAAATWNGNVGVVTTLMGRTGCKPQRTTALVCGPEVMMRHAIATLRDLGIAGHEIYLSMERNMKCAVALCGRCQFNRVLVCRDGPVFRYDQVSDLLTHREL